MWSQKRKNKGKGEGKFLQHQLAPDHEQTRTSKIIALQRKNDIISMLLAGKPTLDICVYLWDKYGVAKQIAQNYIVQANKELAKRKSLEVHDVINLHLDRYELIYEQLRKIKAAAAAMDVLRAKEKLLQFHREGFHMKVTQGEIQTISSGIVSKEWDLDKKLTDHDKERMVQLLLKAKKDGSGKDEETIRRID